MINNNKYSSVTANEIAGIWLEALKARMPVGAKCARIVKFIILSFVAMHCPVVAMAQVPAVLEEVRVVTADASQAGFILRFTPQRPSIENATIAPGKSELVIKSTLRSPRLD